ncbi:Protein-tyrosine phosphatase,receptor/non-receptor type domain and Protein-tyrosine/Dual specificity phosphatase domain and Protein-tyrosine phosphatase, catalytic domain-containing protein [Strongyloides ratti]|uniref:Protein-tyrosine phosphatase,receptor/non-receptor type domain and Protein-tyrosine/Dual specificity phosphatase domain and Protein-tyrosine phosphatase, catalytic domain-containing protein n=1 Tax=Strongyloides ratti TaxID=34506 RepID=A0A090KTS7_STRRB|nr:Protein-tyrosine phosphatase,receptor/non-receptor type domain and Protein-tyrosine/Dual specificity phosphatase domain and Protein-tyrosine phosphatase, catalytic domain-containing protein [Strongyloides ratti]CEF60811.1 Protein-tyrosine phosphatase,receptor/non-receptor type domain and Protein-tyrosine/Dual specificity phosphatase domain and Protein-tyrosine phosphatase, catalytic domain-containing protein [Strongyloides ratti]
MSSDTPDFYKGEKILIKEMRYTESSIKDMPNTDEMIIDSFTLHQFKILKFTYNYPALENDKVIEKIYYFGPMKDDYNFPNQDILYLANETSIKPNCTINGITYGYFNSIIYENETIKLNEFINNKKNNFERSGDYIILKNNKTNMISLMCRYITLTGSVTLTQTFIKGKKVFMGKNKKGEDIYKILSQTDASEYEKKMADKKKEMESMKKSFIDKLIDYIGIGGTYGLIGGICLFIIIIIIIIIILCYFKSIKPRLIRKKIQKTYPNIFELWNDISQQKLEKYSQIGVKRDYVADCERGHDYKKTCEGFEEIFIDTTSLFDKYLVNCYKNINGTITAYYIDKISPQKKYIISDGPSNNNINYFWELLYRENVKVIVAFIDIEDDNVNYWPKKSSQKYGNINVEFIKNLSANDISHLSIYHFQMTVDVGKPKEITLFHINNWKEHEIPKTDLYITKLYDVISSYSGNNITLIHSSKQPDSRSYIYLYFSCVYEVMKEKKNISNPMEIIKDIRENFYGGSISAIEYAFIIKSLISYFMEKNMLLDLINHRLEFNEQYKKYKYKYDSRNIYKDEKVKYFIRFVNMIDRGKLRYLYDKFIITKKVDKKYITKKCSRFYAILQTPNKTKIRHPELPCYDKHSINIGEKDSTNVEGFIHANEMIYKYGNGKERKIIMCQALVRETVDDTFDMFYRYRVKVVVLLVSKEEIDVLDKCHFKSYPDINKFVQSLNYILINRTSIIDKNSCFYEHDCELQHIATKKTLLLKLIQYMDWPNKNIPVDRKTLYGLYKRAVELCKNDYLVIQCSSGVGKSGTLAMIIHMIDTIDKENPFDLFKSLDFIREHRYKGVQTISQFFLALCILYQHFKDEIKFVDGKLYD